MKLIMFIYYDICIDKTLAHLPTLYTQIRNSELGHKRDMLVLIKATLKTFLHGSKCKPLVLSTILYMQKQE